MQYNAVQCSAGQCNIVQFSAVRLAGHNVWISDTDVSGQKGENEDITGFIGTNMGCITINLDVSGYIRIYFDISGVIWIKLDISIYKWVYLDIPV